MRELMLRLSRGKKETGESCGRERRAERRGRERRGRLVWEAREEVELGGEGREVHLWDERKGQSRRASVRCERECERKEEELDSPADIPTTAIFSRSSFTPTTPALSYSFSNDPSTAHWYAFKTSSNISPASNPSSSPPPTRSR